ncbi:MAG TPA: DUF481 domain-containing protein [Verrucomicrobiae bacterium]|nr:DUF481 domain-containing protein [Verrucomicrobiae bacterium]
MRNKENIVGMMLRGTAGALKFAAGAVFAAMCIIQIAAQTNTPPVPKWDASVALGATATRGNSDTLLFTLSARGDKVWTSNELHLGADGTYGEFDGVKNNESIRGFAQYNRLFTDRWYGYARAEGLHDGIADIDYRFSVGPGVGYYILKKPNTAFSVESGPSFVMEKQGGEKHNYFTVRLAEKFEHKFNDRVRFWEMVEFLPQVDNFDNFIVNAEMGVESGLSKAWALRLVLQDTYDNEPAPGRKQNDFRLIGAIAWKLIHP